VEIECVFVCVVMVTTCTMSLLRAFLWLPAVSERVISS